MTVIIVLETKCELAFNSSHLHIPKMNKISEIQNQNTMQT